MNPQSTYVASFENLDTFDMRRNRNWYIQLHPAAKKVNLVAHGNSLVDSISLCFFAVLPCADLFRMR